MQRCTWRNARLATTAFLALALATGCETAATSGPTAGAGNDVAQEIIDGITVNEKAALAVPDNVRKAGVLKIVSFPHPPDLIVDEDGTTVTGLDVSIGRALAKALNLKLDVALVTSNANSLVGIDSGRYDLMITAQSDLPEKQKNYDFIDWQQNNESYLYRRDHPIAALGDLCGKSVGTFAGSTLEKSTQTVSGRCTADAKEPIDLLSFENSSALLMALESGRIDAMANGRNSSLYILSDLKKAEMLAMYDAKGEINPIAFAGSIVKKDNPLFEAVFTAMADLSATGSLKAIVAKWTDPAILLDTPRKNAAK